jgi:uncharacterized protein involved in exopolysaccharide biosynthesis
MLSQELNAKILELLNKFNMETRRSRATQERAFTTQRLAQVAGELREAEDRQQYFLQRNRDYRNSPDLSFQQERLARDVSMHQQVYTTLAQSLEQAKIEEVRDTPVITVVQAPSAPPRPDSRGLLRLFILSMLTGTVVGILLALARESVRSGVETHDGRWVEFSSLARASLMDVRHPFHAMRHAFKPNAGSERDVVG